MALLRSSLLGLAVAAALVLAGCSEANQEVATSTTLETPGVETWACISTRALTGLNRGSSIGDARQVLNRLRESDTIDRATKDYFEALMRALDGMAETEQLGDSLDAVPCRLV